MTTIISRLSIIDDMSSIGEGCRIWQFSTIGAQVVLGKRCVIGSNCYVGHNSRLGDDVHVNHGVFLPNGSILGHRVFVGPNVTFTDDKHPRVNNHDYTAEPPIVEEDANIGAGAVILPGIRLGKGCTIGAGAIVTRDVPAGETWVGVPAKRVHTWPEPPVDGGWMHREKAKPLPRPGPIGESMGERTKQEWRIEGDKFGVGSNIWLNGEKLYCVTGIDLAIRPGQLTRLTVELSPHDIHVVTDPELCIIVGDRRFKVIEDDQGDLDDGLFEERKAIGKDRARMADSGK